MTGMSGEHPHLFQQLIAAFVRKHNIEQDQIIGAASNFLDSINAGEGCFHAIACICQRFCQHKADIFLIFYNQNGIHPDHLALFKYSVLIISAVHHFVCNFLQRFA